ncbi:uncharacterized protein N0V89_012485 [Didymosphaeria variabile]|uniref:CWH43-like N-terminal domain-containing protein n=1 Tax=Didymosphaeria variabile TaxID=1932322 RepID=A0A9W8X9H7_9PLEO|nr:uncharacterized protein N0V89_012485 [Didymosphaeria variabile]KAJ4344741.1 hypothetical protein N0V89_012485 [Didymosphaeria variabile]
MWFISYWAVPIFSSLVWLAMLIAMLTTWTSQGSPHYSSMDPSQRIAYISDVGAQGLKPLFIAMSAVTVVSLDLAFIFERWLRHTGKLAPNTSIWQKLYSIISIIASIAGAAGLILLSIFDTLRHPHLHDGFLVLFLAGYIISAIFICWEYQRLGIHFREQSILRYSFWIKLSFILLEVALAIAFGVTQNQKKWNAAAVLEWTIAFIFFFYVLSFFIDFMPAVRSKHHQSRETEMDMAEQGGLGDGAADGTQYFRGNTNGYANGTNGYTDRNGYATNGNGYTNGHTNGYTNGYTNGNSGPTHNPKPAEPAPLPSRNF